MRGGGWRPSCQSSAATPGSVLEPPWGRAWSRAWCQLAESLRAPSMVTPWVSLGLWLCFCARQPVSGSSLLPTFPLALGRRKLGVSSGSAASSCREDCSSRGCSLMTWGSSGFPWTSSSHTDGPSAGGSGVWPVAPLTRVGLSGRAGHVGTESPLRGSGAPPRPAACMGVCGSGLGQALRFLPDT